MWRHKWRLGVVGNLSLDAVDGRPPRPGGGPYHCARALRALGTPAVLVTKCAAEDHAALVRRLAALGLPVEWRAGETTAKFAMRYVGDARLMTVEALGPSWTPEDVRTWAGSTLGRAEWVHVAGLASSDFPAATLAELARGRRISLDGQALVRPAATGPLVLQREFDPAVLDHVSVLKLGEEELDALERDPAELGVREVLITRGSRGCLVWSDGRLEEVHARPVRAPDPTGAGDGFIAAYLVARSRGLPPVAAASRATAVVAAVLAGWAA